MRNLLPGILLLASCVVTNAAIAASEPAVVTVTAWENGQQSQSFELPASSLFAAKCVESAEKRKVHMVIEKNKDLVYSCENSKVVVTVDAAKKIIVADKVTVQK